jgi:hypothetical protein
MLTASLLSLLSAWAGVNPQEVAEISPLIRLVEQAERAESPEARRILQGIVARRREMKGAGPNAEALANRFARALQKCARSQEDVASVFGPATPKSTVREIYYRRYREQWIFDQPLRLVVVFDCVKGIEPKLLSVQALPGP